MDVMDPLLTEQQVKRLLFAEVYTLEAIMRIFQKDTISAVTGSESSRLRNKYQWMTIRVHRKLAFVRREVQAAALLIDLIERGTMVKPLPGKWPLLVRTFASKKALKGVVAEEVDETCLFYARSVEEAAILDQKYQGVKTPISEFLTVQDVREILEISRETVYKYSDIRDKSAPLQTIEYGGIHLWYPFDKEEVLEVMLGTAVSRQDGF